MASLPAPDSQCASEGYRGARSNAPTSEGWFKHKQIINRLYVFEDKPLKVVRAEMEAQHNFVASERMYKQRLKEWGFDQKKVKAAEWRYMLRLTLERRNQGKESFFKVHGKTISWSHIRKHLKRKKESEDDFLASGPEYEGADGSVRCFTPTDTTPSQNGHASELAPVHRSPFSPQSSQASVGPWSDSSPSYYPCPRQPYSPTHPSAASNSYPPLADTHRRFSMMTDSNDTADAESIPDILSQRFVLRWIKPLSKDGEPFDKSVLLNMSGKLSVMLSGATKLGDLSSLGMGNLSLSPSTTPPTEDELASKWTLSYFQACIANSQNNIQVKEMYMAQGARTFSTMLSHQNPYLLSGLTLMISILYYHDNRELCIEFLEASCHTLQEQLPSSPLVVPYQYMLLSVKSADITREWQIAKSEELKRSYEQFTVLWNKNHPNALSTLYYYGFCLGECQRFEEAEAWLRECLVRAKQHLGDSHILTIWCVATLARTLKASARGREREAIEMQETAIEGCAKLMPTDHPYSLELLRQCAELYLGIGDFQKGEELYTTVLRGRMVMLGPDSPSTQSTLTSLHNILSQLHRNPTSNAAIQEMRHLEAQGGKPQFAIAL